MAFWVILAEIVKTILTVKKYADTLSSLQSGKLVESLIISYISTKLVDALVKSGVPIDKLHSSGLLAEAESWADGKLKEVGDALLQHNIVIAPDKLKSEFAARLDSLFKGKSIGNGKSSIRNQTKSADPVILSRGEYERHLIDLEVKGAGMDLTFRRTYRSSGEYFGPFGKNWDHTFNLRLREENEIIVTRLTGELSEDSFIRHPRFGEEGFMYYTPQHGIHDVVVPDSVSGSYILRRPLGITFYYESTVQPHEHRIRRIEDRLGNFLEFHYDPEDQLDRIFINSFSRYVFFSYDEYHRIKKIEDHSKRSVFYTYDDQGYLTSVTEPAISSEEHSIIESYEYESVGGNRKIVRVLDWKGRIIVENEYDRRELSDFFGYVIRQIENHGETNFLYENIQQKFDPYNARDIPLLRVWEIWRNGHQVEHLFNVFGNELQTKQRLLVDGQISDAVTYFRYNADGQIIARLNPDSTLIQNLYSREHLIDSRGWVDTDPVFVNASVNERMSFGNLLATKTRATRIDVSTVVAQELWEKIPSIKTVNDPNDIVVKYEYEENGQLLLSSSDPRHTVSADPLHVESSRPGDPLFNSSDPFYQDHQRHLTRFEYGPKPHLMLLKVLHPDRTRPSELDGISNVTNIAELFVKYDANGRVLEKLDGRGYTWFCEYYDSTSGPKEGFLRRELKPHIDLILNNGTLDILEIKRTGTWDQLDKFMQSGGMIGDTIELTVEGVRLSLFQTNEMTDIISANQEVAVTVDGVPRIPWNQSLNTEYTITDLKPGVHSVKLNDTLGIPFTIGRVQSHASIDYDIDDLGHIIHQFDPSGNLTTNTVDVMGRKTKIVSGPVTNPSVTYFSYDLAGQLILERSEWRNANGQTHPEKAIVRNYEYNKGGLLVYESWGSVDGNKRTICHRYDTDDNLYESINSRGVPTYFTYDELNRPSKTIRGACSFDKSVTTTIYDIANNVLATIDPRNAIYYNGYIDAVGLRHSGIDTRGRIWAKTDPLGNVVRTDFDAIDNATVIRQFQHRIDGKEELVSRKETQYDEHGDVIRSMEAVFDSHIITADPINDPDKEFMVAVSAGKIQRAVTEYHLDAHGNILNVRDPAGGIQQQQFDGQNRWYDQIDAEGRRTFRIFDANGNIKRIYIFDPVRDQSSNKILYYEVFIQTHEYDELNRELSHMDPYGNRWSQEFDSLGNKTMTMDPLGNTVRFDYNSFGELIATIQERTDSEVAGGNPLPALVTRRHYDQAGNVIDITDPLNRHTKFTYDDLDRMIGCWFAVGTDDPREIRKYDSAGNLLYIQYRNGVIKKMTYDLMNRNIRTDIDTSSISSDNALSSSTATFNLYHYDAAGNRKREENDYCTVEIDRDSRGMPIAQRVTIQNIPGAPGTLEFTQKFDIAGRRTELVYPSGRQISYVYDLMGRVLAIQNVSSPPDYPGRLANANDFIIASYTYTGRRLARINLGNKLSMVLQFDGRGNVLERSVHSSSEMLWRLQQLRDAAGYVRFQSSITAAAGAQSRKYTLDSIYRLTHYHDDVVQWVDPVSLSPAQSPVDPLQSTNQDTINNFIGSLKNPLGEQTFEYDDMGNFNKMHEPGLMPLNLTSNILNQYTLVNNVPWQYDANGNLKSDGIRSFRYDANYALQDITDEATSTNLVTYFHDSVGRVVAEKTQLGTVFRIYNSTLPLVEISAAGRIEFTAGHQSDAILHAALGGEDYWLSYDGLLSMRLLTNSSGEVISMPSFRPFGGSEDNQIQLSPLRSTFGGMWHTPGLPFYHSDRRTYRPDVGRYLQRDPAGPIDSLNLYSYVSNNPVNYIDLTGLQRKIASKVVAEALEWLVNKAKGVAAHGAKRHVKGGRTQWEKLTRKLTNKEARIRYLREYEAKSVLKKGNQAKKFVTRTLKKYDRAIYEDWNKRWVFFRDFGRQIGREGETGFSVVVEEATGKIKTFFPTRTMVALVAAGTGSLTAFGEGVAEASTHGEREELEFIKRHHLEDFQKEEWVLDTLNDLSADNERSWIDEGHPDVPAGIAKRVIKSIESETNTPLDEQTKSDINGALFDAYFHIEPEIEVDEPEDIESIDESIDAELDYLNVPVPSIVTHRDY